MKKLFILFTALIALGSCKKSDIEIFDQKPEERMNASVAEVKAALLSSPNGWIATLPTFAGGGYGFYMQFDDKENVKMYADLTATSPNTVTTSTYRLKTVLGTELIFDTFNYISMLVDPTPSVFGGAAATGYKSDVEFLFTRSTADSLIFKGKKYGQVMAMVKATAAQKTTIEAGGYKTAIDKFKNFFATTKNPYIDYTSGTTTLKVGMTFDFNNTLASGKRVSFSGLLADGKAIGTGSAKFGLTVDGAELTGAGLVYQGITFKRYAWKDATTLAIYDSTGKEYIIKSNPTPLIPLHLALGVAYTSVLLPQATTYPGWSTDFITRRALSHSRMNANIVVGGAPISLGTMRFTFNDVTKVMSLVINTPYGTAGASLNLTYNYTYTKTEAGVYKFTINPTMDGNSSFVYTQGSNPLHPLLHERINVDNFTVDYMVHPTTGALLAVLTSVQNPTFVFSGTI